jgi:hypothetical protein
MSEEPREVWLDGVKLDKSEYEIDDGVITLKEAPSKGVHTFSYEIYLDTE